MTDWIELESLLARREDQQIVGTILPRVDLRERAHRLGENFHATAKVSAHRHAKVKIHLRDHLGNMLMKSRKHSFIFRPMLLPNIVQTGSKVIRAQDGNESLHVSSVGREIRFRDG